MDIASSSSSAAAPADADDTKKYDVFISFRGEDTRRTFTSHLHAALLEKKITTYIDDELKRGDEIAPALLKAIKESELSVIIFSKDYASSTWCLDELVHILECKEKHRQLVIPIFYDTLPSDVRNQRGSYEVAFAQLEQRFQNSIDKVHKWRDALTNAANISGFDSKNYGTDADLVKKVVEDIWTKLCRASSCDLKGFVGIESRIEQVESLLGIHSLDACITVGIWGMGGIGKTTLAETVFHRLSSKFEASCFVKNVRENSEKADGLDHLEKTLLKEILKEEGLSIGSTIVRKRLSCTKVLIVLDDVSSSIQMERLAGDHLRYGTGSRIIITSRDRGTLGQTVEEDNIYEIEVLKPDDALQLFCSRAFKNNSTRRTDYKESAKKVVHYAGGVPLALTVLGSLFFNCKSKEDWEDEFNKLKRFPSESIQKVLRISYDRLEINEKEIFLDIACFHKGWPMDEVKRMLDVRGFFATAGIRILIDMSLISIDSKFDMYSTSIDSKGRRETIEMHDLLQEMGRKIVQEQCIKDPCKWNRLFTNEDVYCVLKSNTETPNVEVIRVDWSYIQKRALKCADFKKISNLIMLIMIDDYPFTACLGLPDSLRYLEWWRCPLESLPSNFCPENLVELHMPFSNVKKLWKEEQRLVNLEVIDLQDSRYLTEVPNLSGSLKIVKIDLSSCSSLVEVPSYFQHLDKLTHLHLGSCTSLKYLLEVPRSIQHLDLHFTGIKELPESVWPNENISYLNISFCKYLEKLPSNSCELKASNVLGIESCTSLGEFTELPRDITKLSLVGFKRLVSLPTHICKLKYLEELNLSRCSELENFPEILEPMEHLKYLNLSGTTVKELPSSIEFLPALKRIQLKGCYRLSSIPNSTCKLKSLEELNLSSCYELENFPEILEPMEHLKYLNLSGTAVKELPSSIEFLPALKRIQLKGCYRLSSIPKSICKLICLEELDVSRNLIDLQYSKNLIEVPNLSGSLKIVKIDLFGCSSLVEVPSSFQHLDKLTHLDLGLCTSLKYLPEVPGSIQYLNLQYTGIKELPESVWSNENISYLNISFCKYLEKLPSNSCELKASNVLGIESCTSLGEFIELPRDITKLSLVGFTRLVSLPTHICKLKYLEELDLSSCSKLENFPEILEPMEHLKCLNLSGTAAEKLPSSIKFLPALKRIQLKGCYRLSSIPKSICQLKCLEELDVSRCCILRNFPEILEPMENLKSLNLSRTAIEELHPSIEFLLALEIIELRGCKRLSRITESICKLKSLKELDLSNCSKLENFPEILEQMEKLVTLNLSRTAVEELHPSIELLPALESIKLQGCKRLSRITASVCKLKSLKELDLSSCSELENFPEILGLMEHLKYLNLSGTAVEELPSSIEFFPALKRIQLKGCYRLSSIPKSICQLKCLEELDVSRCCILRNFPEILEPMESLKSLNLSRTAVEQLYTSSIEFLPALKNIELEGCNKLSCISKTMLKYVKRPDLKVVESSDESETIESEIEDDSDF